MIYHIYNFHFPNSFLDRLNLTQDPLFYLLATRVPFGYFTFETAKINASRRNVNVFRSLNFEPDTKEKTNFQCLTAIMNSISNKLDLMIKDCSENHTIICRKVLFAKPDCSRPSRFTSQSSFAVMLDPSLKLQNRQAIAYKKAEMKEMMSRLNQTEAFRSIFATLWYASLPCFDVRNITARWNGDRALLRYCEWKGVQV